MGLKIEVKKDISLEEPIKAKAVRSAHLGNQYLSNVVLLELGARCWLYDRNLVTDQNYHPAFLIKDGKKELLVKEEFFNRNYLFSCVEGKIKKTNPAYFHYQTIQERYPQVEIFSDYLLEDEKKLSKVLQLLKEIDINLFNRLVKKRRIYRLELVDEKTLYFNCDGKVYKIRKEEIVELAIEFSFKLKKRVKNGKNEVPEGILWNNLVNVILSIIFEVENAKNNTIYHLAGPDMPAYIQSYAAPLKKIWHLLYQLLETKEPEITFVVVPTAFLRLAAIDLGSNKEIKLIKELVQLEKEKTCLLKETEGQKQRLEMVRSFQKKEQEIFKKIDFEKIKFMFYDLARGDFLSHYDKRKIFIPSFLKKEKIFILEKIYKKLFAVFSKSLS